MREIDQCTYEHEGFHISYDGEYGHWTATDPDGEFLANINDTLDEAMIYITTAAEYDEDRQAGEQFEAAENAYRS